MGKTNYKKDFVTAFAENAGISFSEASELYNALVVTIKQLLLKDEVVNLFGLGKFRLELYKGQTFVSGLTGEKVQTFDSKHVKFNPSKTLRALVKYNKLESHEE